PGCYQEYYDDILRAIRTGTEPAVTAEAAALVIRIIEAAFESSKTGKSVRV
ncbi:MAG: Gfo/Idh/MocA family oxidoreductase, partial [Bacteroidales bacterium]